MGTYRGAPTGRKGLLFAIAVKGNLDLFTRMRGFPDNWTLRPNDMTSSAHFAIRSLHPPCGTSSHRGEVVHLPDRDFAHYDDYLEGIRAVSARSV
jgi:hypothetical protein